VLPAANDGSKAPYPNGSRWKHWQTDRPEEDQLAEWFGDNRYTGLGVVCGAVSGGLEMLELEGYAIR
jgi:putative DNA primase/helicase